MSKYTMTGSVFFLLMTLTMGSNIDNGKFNVIISGGNNNIRSGQFNLVDGSENGIEGNQNYIAGDSNEVNGNGNVIVGTGNTVVDSEEEFFKALSLRNSRLSQFLSGHDRNIGQRIVVEAIDGQSNRQNVAISSSTAQTAPTQAQQLDILSSQQSSTAADVSSDLQTKNAQNSQVQAVSTPPIILSQVQTKPATSIKGAQQTNEETQRAVQSQKGPSLTQPQETISTLRQNQNQQKLNSALFPNLVEVKQVKNPNPVQILVQNVDLNSNYGIIEPVLVKEITSENNQKKQTQGPVFDYGIRQPVLIQDFTQNQLVKAKEQTNDVNFFGGGSSGQQSTLSIVKQVTSVETTRNPQIITVKQQTKPSTQQIQPQIVQQQQRPNLRAHLRTDLPTSLASNGPYPLDASLVRDQKDEAIQAVKFISVSHPTDIPLVGMTMKPISKMEYVELTFGAQNQ